MLKRHTLFSWVGSWCQTKRPIMTNGAIDVGADTGADLDFFRFGSRRADLKMLLDNLPFYFSL